MIYYALKHNDGLMEYKFTEFEENKPLNESEMTYRLKTQYPSIRSIHFFNNKEEWQQAREVMVVESRSLFV